MLPSTTSGCTTSGAATRPWGVGTVGSLKVVAELLGHASTEMVDRIYGKVERDVRRKGAAAIADDIRARLGEDG